MNIRNWTLCRYPISKFVPTGNDFTARRFPSLVTNLPGLKSSTICKFMQRSYFVHKIHPKCVLIQSKIWQQSYIGPYLECLHFTNRNFVELDSRWVREVALVVSKHQRTWGSRIKYYMLMCGNHSSIQTVLVNSDSLRFNSQMFVLPYHRLDWNWMSQFHLNKGVLFPLGSRTLSRAILISAVKAHLSIRIPHLRRIWKQSIRIRNKFQLPLEVLKIAEW